MKRLSCLSASVSVALVAVGLSTASVASAAPPEPASAASETAPAPAKKPTRVAQAKKGAKAKGEPAPAVQTVQPTDPAPSEGGGTPTSPPAEPAAPAPAPAEQPAAPPTDPAASDSTPAISIGNANGTPGSDTPGASAEDPTKPPKPRPWAGTAIFATTSMTTSTVFKGQQQYNNPTVDSSLWLQPRYAINEAFQLRGLLVFSYEWTNADDTVTKNEPRFSDTTLSLYYRKIPEIPGGIKPSVALNTSLPTSPESRARTVVFTPGATLQLVKSFEHVLGGDVDLLASGIYSHPLYRKTTPEIRGNAPYRYQCLGGDSCDEQLSGTFNVSDSISYTFLVSATWGKWSPALFYRGTSQWAYTGSDVTYMGKDVKAPDGFEPTHIRQRSYFSAWLDYNANSWLTAEVGYWLDRTALGENGQRGSIFGDRYQDMRVYLGASFSIDNIMKQLEGGPVEAGIVRAQNKSGPIGHF